MNIQPNPINGWAIQQTNKNKSWKKSWKMREKFEKKYYQVFLVWDWDFLTFWYFFVKYHINSYFSGNIKYFQKPLILQAIQWYSSITANRNRFAQWEVGQLAPSKDDIFHSDFAPRKVYFFNNHRNAYIIWNPPPIPFIWVFLEAIWTKTDRFISIYVASCSPSPLPPRLSLI